MSHAIEEIAGRIAVVCDAEGPVISTERDATDLIGEAWAAQATMVVIPAGRLSPEFFRLASGLAGAIVQKHVNYGQQLAIIGDVSRHEAASIPFRDFVREANRGRHLAFVPDMAALSAHWSRPQSP